MVKSDDGKNETSKKEFINTDLLADLTGKKKRPSHPNSSSKLDTEFQIKNENVPFIKKPGKYSGLSNQGATCYLNSLLQSLFMTPEFRINILKWKYNQVLHGPKVDCIPYQLQKLFARLQLKLRATEETKDLTKSFQWTSSEAWEQHDIQELCRVLFDAIEMSLGPNDKNFINELYEGNTISIVKCEECDYMSQRLDKFLDLSLPIRNDFDKIYNKSLPMAIFNFLKPEVLSKDNMYECEKCCKKVDAVKYYKFSKLPKILFVSLMRFEYDILTYQRKKINDKVTFPLLLNFNKYLKNHKEISYDFLSEENEDTCLFLKKEEIDENVDEHVNSNTDEILEKLESYIRPDNKFSKLKFSFDKEKYEQKLKEYLEEGQDVYELFSIVIHSGSALGGHYYAYIKSPDDQEWYCFSDSSVSNIEINDIKKIFGGYNNYASSYNSSSSSTGYVLIYRKINSDSDDTNTFSHDECVSLINEELKKEIEQENIKILEDEKKLQERFLNITLKIVLNSDTKNVVVKKTDTIKDFKERILIEYGLDGKYDLKDVKLRGYNSTNSKSAEYYNEEDLSLEDSYIISYKMYTVEFRNSVTGNFPTYDPNEISLFIYPWVEDNQNKTEAELPFDILKISNKEPISNLREKLYELYNNHCNYNSKYTMTNTDLIIWRKHEFSSTNFSVTEIIKKEEDKTKEIYRYPILDNTKLFIEFKNESEPSKFYSLLTDKLSNILIRFNIPVDPIFYPKDKITARNYKLENEIEVKKGWPVKKVKEMIAEYLKLNLSDFIMRKHNHNGEEIRNLKESVNDLVKGIMTSMCIYVELGKPLDEDEQIINIILCKEDHSTFKFFPYKLTEVGSHLIKKSWTVKEMKENLIQEIENRKNVSLKNLDNVLIRECVTDRPAKIFNEDHIVANLNFNENKKILVHEYKRDKVYSGYTVYNKMNQETISNQVQICVRFWDRQNWNLQEPYEILIAKKSKIQELLDILRTIYTSVEPENFFVYKIINGFNTYMDDINKFQFVRLIEKLDMDCDSFPFFLSLDGNLLIVADCTKELTEPSDEKRKFYCRPVFKTENNTSTAMVLFNNNNPSQNSAVNEIKSKNRVEEMIEKFEEKDVNFKDKLANKFRIKEKGIVIKVKKNQIEENMSPEVIDDSMANIKNLYTENLQEEKVSRSQNENSLLDENKKIKENMNEKNAIDYSDYIIDNDNDFLEPLI